MLLPYLQQWNNVAPTFVITMGGVLMDPVSALHHTVEMNVWIPQVRRLH